MRGLSRILGALPLAAALACGSSEPEPSRSEAPTGQIEGTVRWVGEGIPEPTRVDNSTDPEVCGRSHSLEDLVVSAGNGGVRHVLVALTDVAPESIPPLEPSTLTLDNVSCRFEPHASVVTTGSVLEAVNSDAVLHTVHLYGPADVNLSLPVKGAKSARELERPGLYVVKCDVHGWMQAFVRVDPHPFHAVTDETGRFRIEDVPAGTQRLELWHETLGAREVTVEVRGGETSSVEVEYPSPQANSEEVHP